MSDAERLTLVVGRLNRRLQAATGGLSHGLLSTLAVLTKHGPLRLSDLAQLEDVSAPSMTRTIAELESRG
ncbi:MAG: MarR family transcriptional regulator, partial [Actinomycetota bacterium]|nr:MarR family transcriptional regulator [Actinomycetota bacterium]